MAARAVCTSVAVAPVARASALRPARAQPAAFVSNGSIKKTSAMQGARGGGGARSRRATTHPPRD